MSVVDSFLPWINDWALGPKVEPLRSRVASSASGRVLEIGAGTGLNFRHYRPGVEVTAIEPAVAMRRRAETRARGTKASIQVMDALAYALPAEDESIDTVILTFVLCSVKDVATALVEVRRVLRPGGEVRILEHVKSPDRRDERIQRALDSTWKKVFGGCSLVGDPRAQLDRAGFDVGALEPVTLPLPLPVRAGLIGVAVRR